MSSIQMKALGSVVIARELRDGDATLLVRLCEKIWFALQSELTTNTTRVKTFKRFAGTAGVPPAMSAKRETIDLQETARLAARCGRDTRGPSKSL